MQQAWVRHLACEDPTCRRATKPQSPSYLARALEPGNCNCWGCVLQLLKTRALEPRVCNERSCCNEKPTHPQRKTSPHLPQLEKSPHSNKDLAQPKIKLNQDSTLSGNLFALACHPPYQVSVYLRLFA